MNSCKREFSDFPAKISPDPVPGNSHSAEAFGQLPVALAALPGISPRAKNLWAIVSRYHGINGSAFPSRHTLAHELGCTPRTVTRLSGELRNHGWLVVEERTVACRHTGKARQTTNRYIPLRPDLDNRHPSPKSRSLSTTAPATKTRAEDMPRLWDSSPAETRNEITPAAPVDRVQSSLCPSSSAPGFSPPHTVPALAPQPNAAEVTASASPVLPLLPERPGVLDKSVQPRVDRNVQGLIEESEYKTARETVAPRRPLAPTALSKNERPSSAPAQEQEASTRTNTNGPDGATEFVLAIEKDIAADGGFAVRSSRRDVEIIGELLAALALPVAMLRDAARWCRRKATFGRWRSCGFSPRKLLENFQGIAPDYQADTAWHAEKTAAVERQRREQARLADLERRRRECEVARHNAAANPFRGSLVDAYREAVAARAAEKGSAVLH